MWPIWKKAEKPANVVGAEKPPAPIPDTSNAHSAPVVIIEEPSPAHDNDSDCALAEAVPDSTPHAAPVTGYPEDDMTHDLALRVMEAVSAWRTKYHLENLPNKIVLTQAMNILLVMKNSL